MVLGHANFPLTHFIYLFHIPIFFIASGYCHNPNYSNSLSDVFIFLKKRISSLYIPSAIYSIIYLFLWNAMSSVGLYTSNIGFIANSYGSHWGGIEPLSYEQIGVKFIRILLFLETGGGQMGAALWFLRCLFFVSIIYASIDFILQKFVPRLKMSFQAGVSVLLLFISSWMISRHISLLGLDLIFATYILYYLGLVFKKVIILIPNYSWKGMLLIFIACLSILVFCNQIGSIDLSIRVYKSPLFLITTAISGWILVYFGAQSINHLKIGEFFSYIGRNTIPIIGLHFLCFKLVTVVQISTLNLPNYLLAGFPVLIDTGYWWLLYAISGIAIPISLNIPYKRIKASVQSRHI